MTLRNDINTNAADQQLIGTSLTRDSSATNDVNGVVILTSTGTYNGASRTITAVVQRGNLNINAAVSLPGVQTDTFTNAPPCGGCYSIDGRNWKIADTSSPTGTPSTPKLGVATYTGTETSTGLTYEANAEAGFDTAAKRGYVQGLDVADGSSDAAGTGRRSIAADASLNPTVIQNFLTNLSANPQTQILSSTQACQYSSGSSSKPEGLRMTSTGTANTVNVTNNCSGTAQVNQTVSLGSCSRARDRVRQGRVRSQLELHRAGSERGPADHRLRHPGHGGSGPVVLPVQPVHVERHRHCQRPQRGHRLPGRQQHRDPRCPHRQRDLRRRGRAATSSS